MIKRIVVSVLLVPLLFIVTLWAPEIILTVFVSVFSAIAVNELLYNTKLVRHPRMLLYTMIMAFLVPLWCHFGCSYPAALIGMLAFYVLLFGELMLAHTKIPFSKAAMCTVAGVVIPVMLSSLTRIVIAPNGRYFIMLPFVVAFLSDVGGYFVGVTFGKHKLCPIVSPKKTVEGLIGGVLLAMVGMLIYGLILQLCFGFSVNYFCVIVYGLIGSLAGVFGDLSFSVIKRQTGIKDYGNLIPGHGGVLDRFDSVIVVAPLIEALLLLMPLVS